MLNAAETRWGIRSGQHSKLAFAEPVADLLKHLSGVQANLDEDYVMAGTAVMAAIGLKGQHDQKKAGDKALKRAETQAADLKTKQDEEALILAESTPSGSMNTTRRIANERLFAAKRAGKGRRGTVLSTNKLG